MKKPRLFAIIFSSTSSVARMLMARSLIKPEQVAEQFGMSLSWVYEHKQDIGFVQFGSAVRFDQQEVEEYARNCRRGPQRKEDRKWDTQSRTGKTAAHGLSAAPSTASALKELFAQKEKRGSTR
ncbi:DNA binding domain-containing protein, excisionase family [Halomonas sp. 59]|nr:DNA binding domain-containing protein, excisionase family [Halomonas sp. 59]CAD5259542.1 DNA binding domain-containing protein, excisionase family [Halomonas sp. I3]CAD5295623.1 DNA binding domain-containing protein, excisionase family [Halomonas sp. 156]VXB06619.1 DNA binding domain-containing protein, excisionase family [Halomonas titanicae]